MERDSTVRLSYHRLDDGAENDGADNNGGVAAPVMALLTLDRAEQMNPIDHHTALCLRDRLAEALGNPAVRMVAFTGAGKAFSAGGDMKKYLDLQTDPVAFPQFLTDLHGFLDRKSVV